MGKEGLIVWSESLETSPVVPWGGVDVVVVEFSNDLIPRRSDLAVQNADGSTLSIIAFSVHSEAQTATWQFGMTSLADRLQFSLFDGSFQFSLPLLPGDVNQDGTVDSEDYLVVLGSQFTAAGDVAYDPRFDVTTDGKINLFDLFYIRRRLETQLPEVDDDSDDDDSDDTSKLPNVEVILAHGTAWDSTFLDVLNTESFGDGGIRLGQTAIDNFTPLPWSNVNQITLQFSEWIALVADDLTLLNSEGHLQAIVDFRYSLATNIATWTYEEPLASGDYDLRLRGNVSDAQGHPLGTIAGPLPSNSIDTPVIGDLSYRFSVLPGDVNRNRIVDALDTSQIRGLFRSTIGDAQYNLFADINADGRIDNADLIESQQQLRMPLPDLQTAIEPMAPAAIVTVVSASSESAPSESAPSESAPSESAPSESDRSPTKTIARRATIRAQRSLRAFSQGDVSEGDVSEHDRPLPLRSGRATLRHTARQTARQQAIDALFNDALFNDALFNNEHLYFDDFWNP